MANVRMYAQSILLLTMKHNDVRPVQINAFIVRMLRYANAVKQIIIYHIGTNKFYVSHNAKKVTFL